MIISKNINLKSLKIRDSLKSLEMWRILLVWRNYKTKDLWKSKNSNHIKNIVYKESF